MKSRKHSFFPPAIISITLLSSVTAYSQITWDGSSSSDWTNGDNWVGDAAPALGNNVLIDVDVANQPAITSAINLGLGGITIGDTGASGSNTSLLLGAGGALTTASVTLAAGVDSTGSLLIGNGSAVGTLTSGGLIGGLGSAFLIFDHSDAAYGFGTDISGSLSISHQGSGTTILSGTNTFVGDTNLLSGVLAINSEARLGAAANQIVFDGGTLRLDGAIDMQRTMILSAGGGSINSGSNDNTFSNNISGIGSLSLNSQGTLTFAGTNKTYSGTTSLVQGTLVVTESGGLSASSALALSAGTLVDASTSATQTVAGLNGAGDLVLGSGAFSVNSATDSTFSGTISGDGSLSKSGSGVLTLEGANTYLGGTLIDGTDGGGISITSDNNLGNSVGGLSFQNGGTLEITAGITSARDVVLDGVSFLNTINGSSSFSGEISGSGSLNKTGAGSLTLSGSNSYSGGTVIDGTDGGSLSISSNANLGAVAGGVSILNAGTLEITAGITSARNVVLDGGSVLNTTIGTSTFSGVFSGTGGLVKTGAGTIALAGTNTFTGDTFVNEGKLITNSDAAFGATVGNIQLGDGTTLETTASLATSRSIFSNGNSASLEVKVGSTFTINGVISGSGGISKTGDGILLLNTAGNDYAGVTVVSGGSIRAGVAGAFNATSSVSLGTGTNLNLDGHDQTIGSLAGFGSVLLGSGTLTTDTTVGTDFSGVISGTGGLVKSGTGALTLLNTTSSYSGGTTVNGGGTLIVAGNESLGSPSGGIALDNGTLKLKSGIAIGDTSNRGITLGASSGTFDTSGRTWTLNGAISGDGTLVKTGAGTLVLGNSGNTYSGGTLLSGGAIQISSNAALGNLSGEVSLEGGSLIVTGSVVSARNFVGGGSLIKEGTGMLHLIGTNNSYEGGTFVNQGTLRFNNDLSLGDASSMITLNGGSLSAAGNLASNRHLFLSQPSKFEVTPTFTAQWNGPIVGDHTLTKTGAGTLIANGGNAHKGFIVEQGTLEISNDANIGGFDSSVTVRNNSTLRFGASGAITKDIKLGSATLNTANNDVILSIQADPNSDSLSAVTKVGSGSLTVLSSTKSGSFNVAQGILIAGDAGALASHYQINLTSSAGVLALNGFDTSIRSLAGAAGSTVLLGSNTLTINTNSIYATNGNFAGNVQGMGSLLKTGSYTQTLSGTNTYAGGTSVNEGQLIFGSSSAVPTSGLITNTAYTGAGFAMDQAFLDRFDKAASTGVIGIQVDTGNNLSLAGFSSAASIGSNVNGVNFSGDITPQGSTYRFSGGYGQINLSSDLSGARDLYVAALQVNLSGTNTLSNGITAGSDGVVVFENASSLPGTGNLTAQSNGYIGSVAPVNQAFLDRFDKSNTQGVIGFNSSSSNNLDLTGFGAGASLGTIGEVTISGTITPQGTSYRFGGVWNAPKGTMTVQSNLTGSRGLDIGRINLILTGANNYSGVTTVSSGGVVQVDNDTRLGTGKLILNDSTYLPTSSFASSREIEIVGSGTIQTGSGITLTQNGNITGNGHLYKAGAGTVVLNGNNALTSATVENGVLRFSSVNAISNNATLRTYWSGTAELAGVSRSIDHLYLDGGVVDLGSANLTINSGNFWYGQIQGTGSLVKTSTGSLFIDQANLHSGGTVLQNGTTSIRSGGAFGTGALTLSGGSLVHANTGNTTLTLANNVTVSAATSIMTGSGENSGMTFTGSFSGSGNITKSGASSLTLAGISNHSGTITVADGTLRLTGSTNSGLVANTSTSLITGDGSTAGLIAVSNSGVVSPGNSPGTLGAGSLQLGAGGIYDWEMAGIANYDSISVSGNINITATAANPFLIRILGLDGSNNPGFVSGFDMASSYVWILASGASISGFNSAKFELDLSGFHNPANAGQFTLTSSNGDLLLNYAAPNAIPEPSGALLLVLGTGALMARRRRDC